MELIDGENEKQSKYAETARALTQKYIIADLHVDVPYRLEEKYVDVSHATHGGDFDYPRAKAGGLSAPFMSIYVPASIEFDTEAEINSTQMADKLIDSVEGIVKNAPDKFALAYSVEQMQKNFAKGLISLPMGMENGSPIAGDLKNLEHFYQRGIRYITLSHSLSNHISDSSYDEKRPNNGLSDFGKELVVAMNDIGVMVDVSHISDKAFFDVMETTKVPVIASHSSARHFTPGFERNMSDEMIKALAENGGVIFINFGSTFVHQPSRDSYAAISAAVTQYMQEIGVKDSSDPRVVEWRANYIKANPFEFADIEVVLDHFDHVIKLVGVEHVGIGSDYDGVGDTLPTGLKDAASFPSLVEGFLKRGYSEQDIEKILSGNLIRVWKQVEEYAAKP
ncbi:MAG: membrane dipeptidase [Gammaproteobacteria bacterium]|nr:membrane dipeptidase [Gammaproteobacteria bacterium]